MNFRRFFHPKSLQSLHKPPEYWENSEEMHKVIHGFPDFFNALILEFLEGPLSREDLLEKLGQIKIRVGEHRKQKLAHARLDDGITFALEHNVLREQSGKYLLTPAGRELAEHTQLMIPAFMAVLFSAQSVSIVTIAIHVLLSILKLTFGFISASAGLMADGIDNTADTLSSVFVWVGIRFQKETLVSFFIVIMMFLSVGGVFLASYHKCVHPEPVHEGMAAVVISAVCGLVMFLLSAYQYTVGKQISNFAIMCQAVDSRNHVFTSLLVCGGILLSFLAEAFHTTWSHWLYYADAVASGIIGILILQSAVELARELIKPESEPTQISHFMKSAQERVRKKIVFDWLSQQLQNGPLSQEQLEAQFTRQLCERIPKIFALSGMGYCPENSEDLQKHLSLWIKEKKLVVRDGKYHLPSFKPNPGRSSQ